MKKGNGFVTVLCRNPTYLKCFSQKDKNLHKEIDDAIRPYGSNSIHTIAYCAEKIYNEKIES